MRTFVMRAAVAAILVAWAGAPVAAEAQRARRYEADKKDPSADLGKKKDTGLDESLKADLTRKKTEAREARPALQFDQFRRTVELQVAEKRREQIATLKQIVDLGPDAREAPGLLFRLAELYWEEAKFFFFQAHAKDDEIIAAQGDPGRIEALRREQKDLNGKSDYFRQQAIERYREIVKTYPKYERLDEVLFSLASNLWEQDDRRQAVKVYTILIRRFGESEYIPDSWLAVGEYFFNKGEVRKALKAYGSAAKYPEAKVYGFAMYKQGWCYYNLGEWAKALDQFKAVILYGDIAAGVSGDNKIALVREARRDYVLAYSHVGSARAAKADFASVGGEQAPKMIRNLASIYYDEGKDREAIVVYHDLIREQPLSPESPGYQARIVDAAQRIGNKGYTVKQARLLVRIFEEVEKAGVAKTDKEKQGLVEAKEFAERTLRTLAVTWHSEAKKTRDDQTFTYAMEMYADYVSLFPDSKFAYEMHFYYGELLYHLEHWAEAADEYTKALSIDIQRIEGKRTDEDGKPEKPGKFLVDAAFNAILSYEEVARKFEETEDRTGNDPSKALDVPPAKQALLDACERYLTYVPHGEKQVEVAYKAANIYYRYNRFDEAVERFAKIALDHPTHELAEYSANLILDSYNLLDRPEKVNEWARKLYANKQLAKGKFASDLRQVIEDSALTMVENLTKKGDHEAAAKAYEGFVHEFPQSKKADRALYNASVEWANARQLDRALELRARIIAEYPRSELVPESIFTTAKGYESMAEFDKAARYYETYAGRFKAQKAPPARGRRHRRRRHAPPKADGPKFEEAKAQEALFNAGVLREGLGQFAKARANRLAYVELWPGAKDTKDLFLSVAELFEKQHQYLAAVRHLDAYLSTYAKGDVDAQLSIRLRQAKLLQKTGPRHRREVSAKYDEILTLWQKLGRRRGRVDGGLLAVATAELRTAAEARRDYEKVRLSYPWEEGVSAKRLADQLNAAAAMLQKAQEDGRQEFTNREVRMVLRAKKAKKRLERGIQVSNQRFQKSQAEKAKALQDAVARYTAIVKYKQGEPALCALEQVGLLYLDFVDVLKKAPKPPYVFDADQEAQFRDLLAQQALPAEDQAVEAFAAAVKKSRELMLYTRCARRSLKKLQALRPAEWPTLVEERVDLEKTPETREGNTFLTEIQPLPEQPAAAPAAPTEAAEDVAEAPSGGGALLPPEEPGEPEHASGAGGAASQGDPDEPVYAEPNDEDLLP